MRLHRRAHHRLRGAARPGARVHAGACGPGLRPEGRRHRAGGALVRRQATARADAVAVLPGPEPEQQRHRQEQHADQPAPGHRPDRPARCRAVLADRPAQCDGRARGRRPGQPAERAPRPGRPAAPRRSGRAVGRATTCPSKPGKSAVEMFEAAADGQIKALWIVCTNPAQSMPDQATVRRALRALPSSSCCRRPIATPPRRPIADLLLPASSWGEKERHRDQQRAPHQPRARRRAGAGRGARRLAHRRRRGAAPGGDAAGAPPRRPTLFPYDTAESIWNEHRDSTRGRDLDITGLSYAALKQPQQWPWPAGATSGHAAPVRRRPLRHARRPRALRRAGLAGHRRAARRALPGIADHRSAARPVARHEPHRHARPAVRAQRRARAGTASAGTGAAPLDRRRPGARSARAAARWCCRCAPATAVAPAQAFIAMHWGPEYHGRARRQCADHRRLLPAVAAARTEARRGAGWSAPSCPGSWWPRPGCRRTRRWRCASACARLFGRFDYAVCVPFGREPQPRLGLLFRAAAARPEPAALAELEDALDLEDGVVLRYADAACAAAPRHAPAGRRQPAGLRAGRRRGGTRLGAAICCSRASPPPPMAARCWLRGASRRSRWRRAAGRSAPATTSPKRPSWPGSAAALAMPASACSSCRRNCVAAPNAAPACRR